MRSNVDAITDDHRVPRRDVWRAAVLLLAILSVTQYDVLFLGRSLITTNFYNPIDDRPLPENYGNHFVPLEEWLRRRLLPYANLRDAGATWWQWEPGTQFLKQAMRSGEWPFWDPYIAAGTPSMANLVPTYFFPPYTAVVALGASVNLLNAYFAFTPWAASFFTFLFIRRHGVGFAAAATGAVTVLLSGALNQNQGSFFGQTAACLPLTMHVTRWYLDFPTGLRTVVLALVYAMAALSSFPPILVAIFGVTAFYALVALATESGLRGLRRARVRWCLAVLLSLGLVAFCYLPALAVRAATPHVTAAYHGVGLQTMPVVHLYQILSPTIMGGVQTYLEPPLGKTGDRSSPYVPYAGLAAVALALLARSAGGPSARTLLLACAISLVLIALKLVGAPVVQWVGRLPVLSEIHMAYYFGTPIGFLFACLAALGMQAIVTGSTSATRAALAAVVVLGLSASLWPLAERLGVFKSPSAALWIRDWGVLMAVAVASTAAFMAAVLVRHRARVRAMAVAALLGIVAAEGIFNGWYPNPRVWSVFDYPPPSVRSVRRTSPFDRVLSFGALHSNVNSAFGIYSMDSLMAFNPPRIWALYQRYAEPTHLVFMDEARRIPPEAVLDRANIALVGMKRGYVDLVRDAETRGYARVFDDGFVTWLRRPTLPRAFYSSEYLVTTTTAALDAIADTPSRTVILEEQPGFDAAPNSPDDPRVSVVALRNSVTLEVDAPRPGLVYASESFFDGWTAQVNGAPARILPANYAFRAVVVPAGRSRVEFAYWPPGLTTGLVVSGLSLGLVGVWGALQTFRIR
jgi:hypothetical protein